MSDFVVAIGQARVTPLAVITRTNVCPNPSFESNTTSWAGSSTSITRVTTDSLFGSASLQANANATTPFAYAAWLGNRAPSSPSEVVTASAYVKNTVGPTRPHYVEILSYNSAGTATSFFQGSPVTVAAADGWVRISVTGTLPLDTDSINIRIFYQFTDGAIGNRTLIDGVLVEKSGTLGAYFDGNTTNTPTSTYSWLGTTNNSASEEATLIPQPSVSGIPEQVLTVFDSWTLDRNFDDGCTFSFSCPGNSIVGTQISELETDIWFYEQSILTQRFRVIEVTQTWDQDGRDLINVRAVCYRRILASRHVVTDLSFSGVSQGDIVLQLIQHTQAQTNGDLGITLGTTGPTVLRDREYVVGTNILEAITDLTQIEDGLAWDINQDLELVVTKPDLFSLQAQPVVLGTNTLTITRPSGAAFFGNAALVSGDSLATTIEILETSSIGTDTRGRWEKFKGFPTETDQLSLQEAARGLLTTSVSPAIKWGFEIEPSRYFVDSGYQLGDYVLIKKPNSSVPSGANPTVPSYTVIGDLVSAQIVTQAITQNADGLVAIQNTAVQVLQRWVDVSPLIRWVDVDPSLTWFDLLLELL